MKSRRSWSILTLPILIILGIHMLSLVHEVNASANHHQIVKAGHRGIELVHARANHARGISQNHHSLNRELAVFGNHSLNVHANKGDQEKWAQNHWTKLGKWDEQAQNDMRVRISRDGLALRPIAETFGKQANWLPGWELRWWSFNRSDGRAVWAYHARSKSSGERYTSFINATTGKLQQWEPVK